MNPIRFCLIALALFVAAGMPLHAQETGAVIITTGEVLRFSAGQTQEVVVQVGNPTGETVTEAQLICTLQITDEALAFAEDAMYPREFQSYSIEQMTITLPQSSGLTLIAGQFYTVAIGLGASDDIRAAAEGDITCELRTTDETLGSDSAMLLAQASTAQAVEAAAAPPEIRASLQINNGEQIQVSDGQQTEIVVQLGNTGQRDLINVRLTCAIDSEMGELLLVEEAVMPRIFGDFLLEAGALTFPATGGIDLPAGQFYTVGIPVVTALGDSGGLSSVVNCELFASPAPLAADDVQVQDTQPEAPQQAANGAARFQINNAQLRIAQGQQAELVLQAGNGGQDALSGVQIICSATDDEGDISFVPDASSARNFNTVGGAAERVTFPATGSIDLSAGQFNDVALAVRVDAGQSGTVAGRVACSLRVNGVAQATASAQVMVP